ncbi:hypothetical protein SAMN05192564_10478 [Paraburkholderia sartisoli]|uniref:Uncharacterized protein n=1 Tax=Paraburkholderia sartisoli TaxID=83784 RepID=A0A1H4F504_9BURK|nr:hypothetical protein SAMN05192564_10478 [Paraburkholderia sartisoli]
MLWMETLGADHVVLCCVSGQPVAVERIGPAGSQKNSRAVSICSVAARREEGGAEFVTALLTPTQ